MDIERSPTQEIEQRTEAPRGLTRFAGPPVGGPGWIAWREAVLTRSEELAALCAWVTAKAKDTQTEDARKIDQVLVDAVHRHLKAAKQAAGAGTQGPNRRRRFVRRMIFRDRPSIERAISNLDAAEAHLLSLAPASYIIGQMPDLLAHVQRHLSPTDAARQEFERIARELGINDPGHPLSQDSKGQGLENQENTVRAERGKIVSTVRRASSDALDERVRLRSFRNVVVVTTLIMSLLAIGVALTGFLKPSLIPLCFAPERSGHIVIVCPTAQSLPLPASVAQSPAGIDRAVNRTAAPADLIVVELVGLIAAAVAAAAGLRRLTGSSERYFFPVTLAALKLPTGAITAFLGLLLMRANFIPGFSALDSSVQILAWALGFGYAQQLFTRFVDQQAQARLGAVRGGDVVERRVVERRVSDKTLAQIKQQVAYAVDQSVNQALAPPSLPDVEGRLSAAWIRDNAVPWKLRVTVWTGHAHLIDDDDGGSRPFHLSGGERRSETELEVLVDLPGHAVDVGKQTVMIPTEGGNHTWIGDVSPPVSSPSETWVSVYTYGRFLQAVSAGDGADGGPQ